MIIEFLLNHWISVVAIALLIYTACLIITNRWGGIRELAYKLMLLAERTFGDDDGKIKLDFVVRVVYKFIPRWIRFFIKREDLSKKIQKWYDMAKDFLDDGSFNKHIMI